MARYRDPGFTPGSRGIHSDHRAPPGNEDRLPGGDRIPHEVHHGRSDGSAGPATEKERLRGVSSLHPSRRFGCKHSLRRTQVQVSKTRLPGVLVLEWPVYRDARGYFQEAFRRDALIESGVDLDWMQDNISVSARNVVRGLHYQVVEPQAKLVQIVHGAAYDVAVDIRRFSPAFGKHIGIELRAGDGKAVLIPAGFAHGFLALEPDTAFLYKV